VALGHPLVGDQQQHPGNPDKAANCRSQRFGNARPRREPRPGKATRTRA
jgi:hypothetical protein